MHYQYMKMDTLAHSPTLGGTIALIFLLTSIFCLIPLCNLNEKSKIKFSTVRTSGASIKAFWLQQRETAFLEKKNGLNPLFYKLYIKVAKVGQVEN